MAGMAWNRARRSRHTSLPTGFPENYQREKKERKERREVGGGKEGRMRERKKEGRKE